MLLDLVGDIWNKGFGRGPSHLSVNKGVAADLHKCFEPGCYTEHLFSIEITKTYCGFVKCGLYMFKAVHYCENPMAWYHEWHIEMLFPEK